MYKESAVHLGISFQAISKWERATDTRILPYMKVGIKSIIAAE